MGKVLKQCIGIDCAKDELVCCLGQVTEDFEDRVIARLTVPNTPKGFGKLLAWASKLSKQQEVFYIVEATGVYHERMAHFLFDQGKQVSVVLPNKIKFFSKSLDTKTVTDKTSAEAIMLFGLKKTLKPWQKPKAVLMDLRSLSRERNGLIDEKTAISNGLHAQHHSAHTNPGTVKRMKVRLKLIEGQIKEIEQQLATGLQADAEIRKRAQFITSIKGVNVITAAAILGETMGFDLITSKKQLTSYAGLDVVEKVSGSSVRGKAKISHKGNKHIRKALYFPAFTAIRYNQEYREHYKRLISRHGIKMKAAVAIQRKLLELMFTLWKNETTYDPSYFYKKNRGSHKGHPYQSGTVSDLK
jgi:transposase